MSEHLKIDPLATPKRLWVCTDHHGHYPVGVASIIMANSEDEARRLLAAGLRESGLDADKGFTLLELNISMPFARVLHDGNY